MTRVSTWNWNESTRPFEKVSCSRMASSFGVPSGFTSSAVCRSVMVAEIGRPGKNLAPPEATKIEPLKTTGLSASKFTSKLLTPMRMSSNSRKLPNLIVR